ncbi:VOC family protein [Paracoccaceae bacterium GXU_MW_L88]
MAHQSRIGALCIDCKTEDLSEATTFWAEALRTTGEVDADGKYAKIGGYAGYPKVLLQAVDHDPRIHLDIETDDKEAEVARMTAIGAVEVARIKGWIVMEAPTGHRFCIVDPQGNDWPDNKGEG